MATHLFSFNQPYGCQICNETTSNVTLLQLFLIGLGNECSRKWNRITNDISLLAISVFKILFENLIKINGIFGIDKGYIQKINEIKKQLDAILSQNANEGKKVFS